MPRASRRPAPDHQKCCGEEGEEVDGRIGAERSGPREVDAARAHTHAPRYRRRREVHVRGLLHIPIRRTPADQLVVIQAYPTRVFPADGDSRHEDRRLGRGGRLARVVGAPAHNLCAGVCVARVGQQGHAGGHVNPARVHRSACDLCKLSAVPIKDPFLEQKLMTVAFPVRVVSPTADQPVYSDTTTVIGPAGNLDEPSCRRRALIEPVVPPAHDRALVLPNRARMEHPRGDLGERIGNTSV
mmetsp:Transcript_63941/g.157316  ORF Transcript_63941/g.157316 Transcript_63941/m.157316 type:complete len:242 (+) Transcript_63941:90-815(+)